jgi:hypothetical protein
VEELCRSCCRRHLHRRRRHIRRPHLRDCYLHYHFHRYHRVGSAYLQRLVCHKPFKNMINASLETCGALTWTSTRRKGEGSHGSIIIRISLFNADTSTTRSSCSCTELAADFGGRAIRPRPGYQNIKRWKVVVAIVAIVAITAATGRTGPSRTTALCHCRMS